MENKKIKNATPKEYNGIIFKSQLEASACKLLTEAGLNPVYESQKIVLMQGFKPSVPFYTKDKKTKELVLNNKKVIDLTYTPDFIVKGKKITYYLEIKGFANDSYPIKKKLFRQYLESTNSIFFELFSIKDIKQAIEIINKYERTF